LVGVVLTGCWAPPAATTPSPRPGPVDDGTVSLESLEAPRPRPPREPVSDTAPVVPVVVAVAAPDPTAPPPCTPIAPLRPELTDPRWGPVLHDLARHIPNDNPWHPELPTAAHEATHLMNTVINRSLLPGQDSVANGFYVLNDCAVLLREPSTRKRDAAAYVPAALQGFRFAHYVTGQESWDDVPTYIIDEWISYVHGAAAAIELLEGGHLGSGRSDRMAGQVEFTIYGLALGASVRDLDPAYFASSDGLAFKQMLAFTARRSLEQFRAYRTRSEFASAGQEKLYEGLRTSADGAPLRAFVADTWGPAFAASLLDLPTP